MARKAQVAHFLSFAVMIPFLVLLCIHHQRGYTNALLMGDRESAAFNLILVPAFLMGALGYFALSLFALLSAWSWRWLAVKVLFFVGYVLAFGTFLAKDPPGL